MTVGVAARNPCERILSKVLKTSVGEAYRVKTVCTADPTQLPSVTPQGHFTAGMRGHLTPNA
jgi:hypothetical protein